jgi:hypothetical protein
MRTKLNLATALAVFSTLLPFYALGSIVYENATTDLNRTYFGGNGVEFGDEINLAGTARTVVDFKFEYFLSSNASGNETVQLLLHANDGPVMTFPAPVGGTRQVATPGKVLYTSPVLSMQTGVQTAEVTGLSVTVPNTLTWTVIMNGVEAGEVAGLRVYDPPTVGSSFRDLWRNDSGVWNAYLFDDNVPANFAALVEAVPEPSTCLAGVLLLLPLGFQAMRSMRFLKR